MVRTLLATAGTLLLGGCYTVDSFVDAPDANPGDGICARSVAGAPRSAATAQTRQATATAARLGPDALARLARGDLTPLHRAELAAARAAARARLREAAASPPPGAPGDEGSPNPPLCTLRAAIMEANAHPWKSVITVPAGTYNLTLPTAAGGGSLEVSRSMRIQGSGAAQTVIDAQSNGSLFLIDGAAATDVEINHLTLQGANADHGGGMRIYRGTVEAEDLIVQDNFAYSSGGGILIDAAGTLRLHRSTVGDNFSAFGGGINNYGQLWVYDSTISDNRGNRAGGLLNVGDMRLYNTTVSGNWVDSPVAGAGGIFQGGFAVLNNVTISDNQGMGNNPGSWRGGGLQIDTDATTVMRNSIVAGNDGVNGPHDCAGTLSADSRQNLIGDSAGCTITSHLATYLLDPPAGAGLGTLTYNGGPTRTHLPQDGSAARNAGYAYPPPAIYACRSHDQRGVPRPQGSGNCDLGAVEVTSASAAVTGFVLVDATTNTDIRPLRNDDWLILGQLPAQVSVRATTGGSVGSVVFGFAGSAAYRTENAAPYTLGGDTAGDYAPTPLAGGEHVLSATPYAAANGGGAAGVSLTIRFNVLQVN